ncbi:HD domain-containing protein [Deinococcus fonticola]|uniref:HD domain-containing protein n=1 Tax=Deinococcus fonticola TaxID=2528713 RepID=UPI001F0E32BC|nr:HD domain-containing protein [Deinococcus fonticola]
MPERVAPVWDFILTADKLKRVTRQNFLSGGSRLENSAEHSWFLALMALVLAEYAPAGTSLPRVVELLLVHDLVEIDAGDEYIEASAEARRRQQEREQQAAARLFHDLPALLAAWDEFEAGETPEAQFARHLDALAPALLTWGEGGCAAQQWGRPSDGYVALKRRVLNHPQFWPLFVGWMEREGVSMAGESREVSTRLARQIQFLTACDALRLVERTTFLHDHSRAENSAEHSWHLALMALLLADEAPPGTVISRVVALLVTHDLVEIYAGDTHFDTTDANLAAQAVNEAQAAQQLFGLLPADQTEFFLSLWHEFEAQEKSEARFARALDALQPMLLTWGWGGVGCTETYPDLTVERLLKLKESRLREFPALWMLAQQVMWEAVEAGTLLPGKVSKPVNSLVVNN